MIGDALEGLFETNQGNRSAVGQDIPLLDEVLEPEFHRIEAQRLRQLVQLRLGGKGNLRSAGGTIRSRPRLVRVHPVPVVLDVRDPVDLPQPSSAACSPTGCPSIPEGGCLPGRYRPIPLCSGLELDDTPGRGPPVQKLVVPRHHHLDRASCLHS